MSVQDLGLRAIHQIERVTGLYVVRAVVNNGASWRMWIFTTDDHQHGRYDRTTQEWLLDDSMGHFTTCGWLFGEGSAAAKRERDDSWGAVCGEGRWHVGVLR